MDGVEEGHPAGEYRAVRGFPWPELDVIRARFDRDHAEAVLGGDPRRRYVPLSDAVDRIGAGSVATPSPSRLEAHRGPAKFRRSPRGLHERGGRGTAGQQRPGFENSQACCAPQLHAGHQTRGSEGAPRSRRRRDVHRFWANVVGEIVTGWELADEWDALNQPIRWRTLKRDNREDQQLLRDPVA